LPPHHNRRQWLVDAGGFDFPSHQKLLKHFLFKRLSFSSSPLLQPSKPRYEGIAVLLVSGTRAKKARILLVVKSDTVVSVRTP
jgi:hypothetical protein